MSFTLYDNIYIPRKGVEDHNLVKLTLQDIADDFGTNVVDIHLKIKKVINKMIGKLVYEKECDMIDVILSFEKYLNIPVTECVEKLNKKHKKRFLLEMRDKYEMNIDELLKNVS